MSPLRKLVFAAMAIAANALAQAPQSLTPHQIKPNVYWLEGGGGNTGVIVGTRGVIIVDAKTTPAFGKMIIDQEANKKEQDAALAAGGRGAPPADHQPNQVVTKTKEAFTIDGEKVELY